MSFLKLSDELLLQIFSLMKYPKNNICSVVLTCHRFYAVALHDVLYRNIEIWPRSYEATSLTLAKLLRTITVRPESASSVREAAFCWDGKDAKSWSLVFDIILKLPSMHTLSLQVEDRSTKVSRQQNRQIHFSDFLNRCADLQIRKLFVADNDLTSEDITKFSTIQTVEHMTIYWFKGGISDSTGLVPNAAPPSNIVKLNFFSATLPSTTVRGPCIHPFLQQYLNLKEPSLLKQFPNLQELTWELSFESEIEFCPIQFISELRPMRTTLVKLNLSKEPGCDFSNCCSCQLNLSQFTAVKVLTLHARVAFKFEYNFEGCAVIEDHTGQELHDDRRGLSERLPPNLEQLEIVFGSFSCFLTPTYDFGGDKGGTDIQWILALAHNKGVYSKHLSTVTLIEDADMPRSVGYSTLIPHSQYLRSLMEWNYPEEVLEAYRNAGISLSVLRKHDRSDCDCGREGRFS